MASAPWGTRDGLTDARVVLCMCTQALRAGMAVQTIKKGTLRGGVVGKRVVVSSSSSSSSSSRRVGVRAKRDESRDGSRRTRD